MQATKAGTEACIRKIGKNDAYTYIHEVRSYIKNERIQKKR